MARRVFYSFHYSRDIWRASQVRNSWVTQDREAAGFWDAADWEAVKRQGQDAVHRWIDRQMEGTSVTVVLIGAETHTRSYVDYEINQSQTQGKGLLGVRINNLKNKDGWADNPGPNPFDHLYATVGGSRKSMTSTYPTYDYVTQDGYRNLGAWIEQAARLAGR